MDELNPIVQEFLNQPIAFLGGFTSGILRLNLTDDPLKSWLSQQGFTPNSSQSSSQPKDKSPQSIMID
jgi:hypothetical protein